MAARVAFTVCVAVGTALAGWVVSRYGSSDSVDPVESAPSSNNIRNSSGKRFVDEIVDPVVGWVVSRYGSPDSDETVDPPLESAPSSNNIPNSSGKRFVDETVDPLLESAPWSNNIRNSSGKRFVDETVDPPLESAPSSNNIPNSSGKRFVDETVDPPLESAPWSNNIRNSSDNDHIPEQKIQLKILTYNVCSREDYGIDERMKAIGTLVEQHSPAFICFQEFTPAIYKIFQKSSWWNYYHCSMSTAKASKRQHFCILLQLRSFTPIRTIKERIGASRSRKELWVTETKVGTKSLVVATSHLKCPGPGPSNTCTEERQHQAKEAINFLQKYPNVIFCGDMNWDEKEDGEFPLQEGWVDAWTELRGKEKGYTFDASANEMLYGRRFIRKRLDRILCNFEGFRLVNITIIGKEAIPDVTYQNDKKTLPVLPSDHYGLLVTICTY